MVEKFGKSKNFAFRLQYSFQNKYLGGFFLIFSLHHKIKNRDLKIVRYYFNFSATTHKNYVKNAKIFLKHISENGEFLSIPLFGESFLVLIPFDDTYLQEIRIHLIWKFSNKLQWYPSFLPRFYLHYDKIVTWGRKNVKQEQEKSLANLCFEQ